MPPLSYQQPGLVLRRPGAGATDRQIRDLQRHLRSLGYLRRDIDGDFGAGTERAVKALRHDLMTNDGSGSDGRAPVSVLDHNGGRVVNITGDVDEGLAGCIADMLDDAAFPKLPFADDPAAANRAINAAVAQLSPQSVPIPFMVAILKHETNLRHYNEP